MTDPYVQAERTNHPEVTLFTHTMEPLKAIALAIDIWHYPVPSQRHDAPWTEGELVEKFRWLLKQPHQTPLEYFSMVWILKGVSRAFQQQLTRHRLASYSIQSLRVVDPGNFAEEGRYHCSETVKDKEGYHKGMLMLQGLYRGAIQSGETTEDARGFLPLNIHSPVTMCINYRTLIGLLKQRMCLCAQGEWKQVVAQMRSEVGKVHPVFQEPLDCMCGRYKNRNTICKTAHKRVLCDRFALDDEATT